MVVKAEYLFLRRYLIPCTLIAVLAAVQLRVHAADEMPAGQFPKLWQGKYFYSNNTPPVTFELRITSQTGDKFDGQTTEPATFGSKPCSVLRASVRGQLTNTGMQFTKTYDGSCGQAHSVYYTAIIDRSGRNIWGTWKISDGFGGIFTAESE